LDGHLEEETVGRVEGKSVEQSSGESPEHVSKLYGCEYCSLKSRERYTLHAGSIFLYVKDRKLMALADIDHVHHKRREGMIDNISFLYSMMCELRSKGYDVVVVGKAFDDDLYVYFVDRVGEEKIVYNGLDVKVVGGFNNVDDFERMGWYTQVVDEETVMETIREMTE
jgi:hypothetical protein